MEGGFFPDWEFETLFGVDRETVRRVLGAWPEQTIDWEDFGLAVINALTNLTAYPHGMEDELTAYVPEGRGALNAVMKRLLATGI